MKRADDCKRTLDDSKDEELALESFTKMTVRHRDVSSVIEAIL